MQHDIIYMFTIVWNGKTERKVQLLWHIRNHRNVCRRRRFYSSGTSSEQTPPTWKSAYPEVVSLQTSGTALCWKFQHACKTKYKRPNQLKFHIYTTLSHLKICYRIPIYLVIVRAITESDTMVLLVNNGYKPIDMSTSTSNNVYSSFYIIIGKLCKYFVFDVFDTIPESLTTFKMRCYQMYCIFNECLKGPLENTSYKTSRTLLVKILRQVIYGHCRLSMV